MWPGCFSALGVLCDPFERQSGTNSAHPKFLLDQDVKTAPCGSILRSSSAPLPSRLVRSIFFLLSLYLLCGHGLLSALLPWLHVSALAPAGPGFVLLLLEGAGSRPGPVWIGVVLALQWNHQLGSWALV